MTNAAVIARLRFGAMALIVALTLSSAPIAHAHGGGGGGGHGGGGFGGGHGGGYGGGHGGGYGGGHGGGYGGRGGFGHRGFGGRGFGYGRFGYGGFGFYDGFGLLGYGLFFDALPLYYSTYWWGGVPYYYANDNFYQWNGTAGQYQTVQRPRASRARLQRRGPKVSTYLRIRRTDRRLSSSPPIAPSVSSGPRVKPGSILRLPAALLLRLAVPRSRSLPRRGRTT